MGWNVPATSANLRHIVEHMAVVVETANKERRHGALNADTIMDCHGYRIADNLNPAPMLAMMKMANQPFRDCLQTALVVDAPRSFYMLWRAAAPLLSEKTKSKVRFVSREEAVAHIRASSGSKAADAVDRAMALNRTREGFRGSKFPSEVEESDGEDPNAPASQVRAVTRRVTQSVAGVHETVTGV